MTALATSTPATTGRAVLDPPVLRREMDALVEMAGSAQSREQAELLQHVAGFVSEMARHDVDERGRCRGCRKPGARVLWRRRQPCPRYRALVMWQLGQRSRVPAAVNEPGPRQEGRGRA
jgi:hypothetical protein